MRTCLHPGATSTPRIAAKLLKGEATFAETLGAVAIEAGITHRQARAAIMSFFKLAGLKVKRTGRFLVPSVGTWHERTRKARRVSHPITHEPMELPKQRTVGFRPTKRSPFR